MKQYMLFLLVLLLIAVPLSGVLAQGREDTLVVQLPADVRSFNVALVTDDPSMFPTRLSIPPSTVRIR